LSKSFRFEIAMSILENGNNPYPEERRIAEPKMQLLRRHKRQQRTLQCPVHFHYATGPIAPSSSIESKKMDLLPFGCVEYGLRQLS